MQNLSEQLIESFLSEHRASGLYRCDHVSRLVELATSKNEEVAEVASRAFFTSLVERLADSFEPAAVTLYNRVVAQLIEICRKDPRAHSLDRELARAGISSGEDVIRRAEHLRSVMRIPSSDYSKLRRIIVLSRVTLGADVAITSVIIERMKHDHPDAEIVLLGGRKSAELFVGDARISVKEIEYGRGKTAIDRVLTWIDLLECVRELTRDLEPHDYLIIDPDSRLTQLGLLPVVSGDRDRNYAFFPSREYLSDSSHSLCELTSMWLDEVFGKSGVTYPRISLCPSDIDLAKRLVNQMKPPAVAANFGVGENPLKRVGGDFEASLISGLIYEGASIILDKGAGDYESARIDAAVAYAAGIERNGQPLQIIQLDESSIAATDERSQYADILVWNGRIGMLAALIAESDLYVGYDSAGQHIAASLQVPCIDVFAGFSSPRMLERWRPTGRAVTHVLPVERPGGVSSSQLVLEVLGKAQDLLRSRCLRSP